MDKVYQRLDKISEDEALSLLYDEREREEEKKQIEIKYAQEFGMNKGLEEGLEKGLEKGLEEGLKQTAKNLLLMNMQLEDISKATGLSINEISNLK